MFRKHSILVAGIVLASIQTALAGGPPWVVIPIEGVTAENSKACAEKIAAGLKNKIFQGAEWQGADQYKGVNISEKNGQRYAMFHMEKDVTLGDVQTALKGSGASIPLDELHLFGHVILEVRADHAQSKQLLADLKSLNQTWIVDSKQNGNTLSVTLETPYPFQNGDRPSQQMVGWEKYQRNNFDGTPAASEPIVSAAELPTYRALREIVSKDKAELVDLRWSTQYACRAVGCVVAPEAKVAATKR
jgi:hypothetical protein